MMFNTTKLYSYIPVTEKLETVQPFLKRCSVVKLHEATLKVRDDRLCKGDDCEEVL